MTIRTSERNESTERNETRLGVHGKYHDFGVLARLPFTLFVLDELLTHTHTIPPTPKFSSQRS